MMIDKEKVWSSIQTQFYPDKKSFPLLPRISSIAHFILVQYWIDATDYVISFIILEKYIITERSIKLFVTFNLW